MSIDNLCLEQNRLEGANSSGEIERRLYEQEFQVRQLGLSDFGAKDWFRRIWENFKYNSIQQWGKKKKWEISGESQIECNRQAVLSDLFGTGGVLFYEIEHYLCTVQYNT